MNCAKIKFQLNIGDRLVREYDSLTELGETVSSGRGEWSTVLDLNLNFRGSHAHVSDERGDEGCRAVSLPSDQTRRCRHIVGDISVQTRIQCDNYKTDK